MNAYIDSVTARLKALSTKQKILAGVGAFILGIALLPSGQPIDTQQSETTRTNIVQEAPTQESSAIEKPTEVATVTTALNGSVSYEVSKVIDGDTIDVSIGGVTERVRMIGVNTPETVDPRKPVECFGVEASKQAKSLMTGKRVVLEADATQGERDTYGRLLRYVFLEDGTNVNLLMIKSGFAYEYTYNLPYKYQKEFKEAQSEASTGKIGLWGDVCQETSVQTSNDTDASEAVPVVAPVSDSSCVIKGNISTKNEKIFHVPGCGSYSKTVIDESEGERWFCSEQEALNAGWRKALNCN
jgi:micrococcal nuclease